MSAYKKYILFQYCRDRADGALEDIINSFDTMEEAADFIRDPKNRHVIKDVNVVVDRDTWKVIYDSTFMALGVRNRERTIVGKN